MVYCNKLKHFLWILPLVYVHFSSGEEETGYITRLGSMARYGMRKKLRFFYVFIDNRGER